jgi:TetR/AcrR family transcriptional regulator, tetracycline repressor protein
MARLGRPSLSAALIVDAAIELIGERGLDEFSMPKVAASLGVRTSSLYRYFADRTAVLAAVARRVTTMDEAPEIPPPGSGWTEFMVAQAIGLRRRILRYPNCSPLIIQFNTKENVFDEYELMCQFLTSAGVPPDYHVRIVDGLTAVTVGSAVLDESAADYAPGGALATPDPDRYPTLTTALTAIGTDTKDELFAGFLRTYLQAIVDEIAAAQS